MTKKFLYIANWKAYFTHTQAIAWIEEHKTQLITLCTDRSMVLCPSFTELQTLQGLLHGTCVTLGAQDCAPEIEGAYTGQVSAASLKELGCSYCIVGHSELRDHQDNGTIPHKVQALVSQGITPIVCIGESKAQRDAGQTDQVLREQLEPIVALDLKIAPIIAYEPIWAIGTGDVPTNEQIAKEIAMIKSLFGSKDIKVIYGGSITGETSEGLKEIESLDGFLIGKASTDIQELEKIV